MSLAKQPLINLLAFTMSVQLCEVALIHLKLYFAVFEDLNSRINSNPWIHFYLPANRISKML